MLKLVVGSFETRPSIKWPHLIAIRAGLRHGLLDQRHIATTRIEMANKMSVVLFLNPPIQPLLSNCGREITKVTGVRPGL